MSTLGFDEERPFTMDPASNFAIIDHLCRTDPKEAGRIGQTMLDKLREVSILTEIIMSVRSDTTRDRAAFTQVGKVFKTHTVMLRRIAKRMEKWFGWHREMFVERSK